MSHSIQTGAQRWLPDFVIGGLFLLGGIANVFMLPSPLWFSIVELAGAYLPMSYIAAKLVKNKQ